ncbi:MAG: hypothetical protein M1820_004636 [Bogoriella megaspora]|nr:MAG: hypothetical protein M1820_004636 [Bogoriella megaspora]
MPKCPSDQDHQKIGIEDPIWHNVRFHDFGLVFCAVFGGISVLIGFYLIAMHATHYLRPWEQRHIIRILLMIPVYSFVSFLSYVFYTESIYFQVIRDCYEAFAIASFFTLLSNYIAPNIHDQKDYFRRIVPFNWFWGVFGLQKCTGGEHKGPFRRPKSGLTWFNVVWVGVFQYCFIRVFFTLVSCVSEIFDKYCEESLSPAYAHIWVQVFESVSVTIAMFCVIQFYIQLRTDLADYRPFLKVACIKLVIFFSFWQNLVLSFLSSSKGPFQPTSKIAYADIKVGIPSMLLCAEMAIFAVLHVFAFPWKPYSKKHNKMMIDPINAPGIGFSGNDPEYQGGFLGWRALVDAFNPWDIVKAIGRSFRWLFVGRKHRKGDSSYQWAADQAAQSKLDREHTSQHTSYDPTTTQAYPPNTKAPPYDADGPHRDDLELRPTHTQGSDSSPYRSDNEADYEDRAGLLSHAQHDPSSSYPPRSHPDVSPLHNVDPVPYQSEEFGYPTSRPVPAGQDAPPHPLAGALRNHPVSPPGSAFTTDDRSYHPPTQTQGQDWDIWNGGMGRGAEDPEEWRGDRAPGGRGWS